MTVHKGQSQISVGILFLSAIHKHHMHKRTWQPCTEEWLEIDRESGNLSDYIALPLNHFQPESCIVTSFLHNNCHCHHSPSQVLCHVKKKHVYWGVHMNLIKYSLNSRAININTWLILYAAFIRVWLQLELWHLLKEIWHGAKNNKSTNVMSNIKPLENLAWLLWNLQLTCFTM